MGVRSFFYELGSTTLSFLSPWICLLCERSQSTGNTYVCMECLSSLDRFPTREESRREVDGHLKRYENTQLIDGYVGLFYFREGSPFQKLIHALKYQGIRRIGYILGKELGEYIKTYVKEKHIDYIQPVPAHKLRILARGYNQTSLISEGISQVTGIPIKSFVKRTIHKESQTKLTHDKRKANIENVFQAMSSVRGKTGLVVDDIFTTGSTFLSIAKAMKDEGASKIFTTTLGVTSE